MLLKQLCKWRVDMPVSKRTEMEQEEWLKVPGEEYIQVSSLGRIRRGSKITCPQTNVYLRGGRVVRIYHLVLLTFVGPCPDGMECCHYDDDRSNNVLSNLRWDTRTGNLRDRWRNGKGGKTGAIGEDCGSAKLTEDNVRVIRQLRGDNPRIWSYEKLGRKFGVTKRTVILVVRRETWGHVV
jgi:hypothetical protein